MAIAKAANKMILFIVIIFSFCVQRYKKIFYMTTKQQFFSLFINRITTLNL